VEQLAHHETRAAGARPPPSWLTATSWWSRVASTLRPASTRCPRCSRWDGDMAEPHQRAARAGPLPHGLAPNGPLCQHIVRHLSRKVKTMNQEIQPLFEVDAMKVAVGSTPDPEVAALGPSVGNKHRRIIRDPHRQQQQRHSIQAPSVRGQPETGNRAFSSRGHPQRRTGKVQPLELHDRRRRGATLRRVRQSRSPDQRQELAYCLTLISEIASEKEDRCTAMVILSSVGSVSFAEYASS
jgi:hypothetical protein